MQAEESESNKNIDKKESNLMEPLHKFSESFLDTQIAFNPNFGLSNLLILFIVLILALTNSIFVSIGKYGVLFDPSFNNKLLIPNSFHIFLLTVYLAISIVSIELIFACERTLSIISLSDSIKKHKHTRLIVFFEWLVILSFIGIPLIFSNLFSFKDKSIFLLFQEIFFRIPQFGISY
ncbi:hypothetical protein MXB_1220 [Myxobolus squamalis]|nr:hypothetical protein MXB_1220 [Myxobolus squamalis]